MAILKVARMGHPVLRAKARPLQAAEIRSAEVQRLIDDMFDTMREYSGVGLAAPQVHESVRVFVAGIRSTDHCAQPRHRARLLLHDPLGGGREGRGPRVRHVG